jgi:hypothetical protein
MARSAFKGRSLSASTRHAASPCPAALAASRDTSSDGVCGGVGGCSHLPLPTPCLCLPPRRAARHVCTAPNPLALCVTHTLHALPQAKRAWKKALLSESSNPLWEEAELFAYDAFDDYTMSLTQFGE